MILPAEQVIRFRGRDGAKRATKFLQELNGSGKIEGSAVTLTRDVELVVKLMPISLIAHVPALKSFGDLELAGIHG
jgi:hypothetical protein